MRLSGCLGMGDERSVGHLVARTYTISHMASMWQRGRERETEGERGGEGEQQQLVVCHLDRAA